MMDRDLLSGLKILIVDDENELAEMLRDNLEIYQAECLCAFNGHEGHELFKSHSGIDIVITDIKMPKMSGKELVEAIRLKDKLVLIICISGFSAYEEDDIFSWGADAFLHKPLDMKSFFSQIKTLYRKKAQKIQAA